MVPGDGVRHGRDPQCRRRHGRLCDDRPGDLDRLQEQGRLQDRRGGGQEPLQPVRRDLDRSREMPDGEGRPRPAVHRLAAVGRRPEGDRRLSAGRPTAVLPERGIVPELRLGGRLRYWWSDRDGWNPSVS
eukprot:TRINITY_DN4118_c1_g1_i1.p5 TRINITY_DN4118_c1_g1~~TRINITY_DN4118_c1_g1_i1.p5  ORF type:complete len:130 (+),score=9.70 TRINITY_DN4118_c1_g1_i1:57-446(+)